MARKKYSGEKRSRVATKLRKGDPVMVIAGGHKEKRKNKGQVGKILRFTGANLDRVVVEGVNVHVRHQRQLGPDKPAGKVKIEAGVHISNVMYYVEKAKKPVRLVHRELEDGRKVRGYLDGKKKEFIQIDA